MDPIMISLLQVIPGMLAMISIKPIIRPFVQFIPKIYNIPIPLGAFSLGMIIIFILGSFGYGIKFFINEKIESHEKLVNQQKILEELQKLNSKKF